MVYSHPVCQLCGVKFDIARIRRADEPLSAGWDSTGFEYVCADDDSIGQCGDSSGCVVGPPQSFLDYDEHVAGPGCISSSGYSGHRISVEEMSGCRDVQCLVMKNEYWKTEDDDQDFEIKGDYFLTGIGEKSDDDGTLWRIEPPRHGIDNISIGIVYSDGRSGKDEGLHFHPTCFGIFKKASVFYLGSIDVQGLWYWRHCDRGNESSEAFFEHFRLDFAAKMTNQKSGYHPLGCEYLAANPIDIPGLPGLISGIEAGDVPKVNFQCPESWILSGSDPFARLSAEIMGMVIDYLPSKDIANLRFCTRTVRQLPDILFRRLLLEEMPWMWEAKDLDVASVAWQNFYCTVKFCWTGLKGVRNRKRIWNDVEVIVRRIGQLRNDGKIESYVSR